MVDKGRLSSRPPSLSRPNPDPVAAFIEGAGVQTDPSIASPTPPPSPEVMTEMKPYPWQAPGVRDDVHKVYNLRLPEPYLLKLKYIADHIPESMQQFCLNTLLPAIDDQIAALIGTPDASSGPRR